MSCGYDDGTLRVWEEKEKSFIDSYSLPSLFSFHQDTLLKIDCHPTNPFIFSCISNRNKLTVFNNKSRQNFNDPIFKKYWHNNPVKKKKNIFYFYLFYFFFIYIYFFIYIFFFFIFIYIYFYFFYLFLFILFFVLFV